MISEHASPLTAIGGVDSGGQNVYVAQLARHLARRGYAVDVFTRRDDGDLPEVVRWMDGVRIVHVTAGPTKFVRKEELYPHMGEFAENMLCFCENEAHPYDLFHAHFWMSGMVAAETSRLLQLPFVTTFHALGRVRRQYQGGADGFPDDRFDVEERIAAESDAIIAECPQDEQDLVELYGADRDRIRMIPAGFDPAEFAPVSKIYARRKLGLPQDEHIVLQLGRMVPRKGVETVIRGFARLVHQHSTPARLVIVGGESDEPDPVKTPEIGRLQRVAEEEGISDCVMFTGRKSRRTLKYYYSAADVFATLPWYEPFGMTPLEAMGCGTPVIGAQVGGIKFSVVDGVTGYLVPPKDPDAFAARLSHLLGHPELMARFGAHGLRRAQSRFTWSKIAEEMDGVYSEIIESAASRYERAEMAIPLCNS